MDAGFSSLEQKILALFETKQLRGNNYPTRENSESKNHHSTRENGESKNHHSTREDSESKTRFTSALENFSA